MKTAICLLLALTLWGCAPDKSVDRVATPTPTAASWTTTATPTEERPVDVRAVLDNAGWRCDTFTDYDMESGDPTTHLMCDKPGKDQPLP